MATRRRKKLNEIMNNFLISFVLQTRVHTFMRYIMQDFLNFLHKFELYSPVAITANFANYKQKAIQKEK